MKENRILTCIVCPRGCTLEVSFNSDGSVNTVTGNACKRGVGYAVDECTHPKRTVTSTVRTEDGMLVAVKTSGVIPKELVFDCMRLINSTVACTDVKIGDVILPNILGTGVDLVVTGSKTA